MSPIFTQTILSALLIPIFSVAALMRIGFWIGDILIRNKKGGLAMISEEQKLDILRDVEVNVGNWVGEALAVGVVSREFQALNEILQKAEVDLNDLFQLGPE